MERAEMMNLLYSEKEKNEDSRLTRNRHGQLEYLTTMNYIHKFVPSESWKWARAQVDIPLRWPWKDMM